MSLLLLVDPLDWEGDPGNVVILVLDGDELPVLEPVDGKSEGLLPDSEVVDTEDGCEGVLLYSEVIDPDDNSEGLVLF